MDKSRKKVRRRRKLLIALGLVITFLILAKPQSDLFQRDFSTLVLDRDGEFLGARIASDGQWRFPAPDSIPDKFQKCILNKEDQYFYYHPGFNPVALFRALFLNIKHGRVVSGGSTITMQVIRLSRNNPDRTIIEKVREIFLACGLEVYRSKKEILNLYSTHAPFGGNVVGLEAASWRYFGVPAQRLSWAESATLAVLPNTPGLIHPGRNREILAERRNKLLLKLLENEVIDSGDYKLALLEPLPISPMPLEDRAPHLTDRLNLKANGKRHYTSLSRTTQEMATEKLYYHLRKLKGNLIYNGSVLIIDNKSGRVQAYVANNKDNENGYNDMIMAPRSSGSILKPFLYAASLDAGTVLPDQLIRDVPTIIDGFRPENFVRSFDGAVPASEALARSLNIPAIVMLQKYGVGKFRSKLRSMGFQTIDRSAANYGLSLILGGGEVRAWDLGQAYFSMARTLNQYSGEGGGQIEHISFERDPENTFLESELSPASVHLTFKALEKVNRPDSEMGWELFGKPGIAWKTGTSYAYRDAWAVGVTPDHTVVVWIGNADGVGRPGLIGARAAGPVLFDVLNTMNTSDLFPVPYDDLREMEVCATSGLIPSAHCNDVRTVKAPRSSVPAKPCPYHKTIFTDVNGEIRYFRNCSDGRTLESKSWFVLPPVQAWYYSKRHNEYKAMPPLAPKCGSLVSSSVDIIYPENGSEVYIPMELDGRPGKIVFEAAHNERERSLFWHLNNDFIGETEQLHQMALTLDEGSYRLHVEDSDGNFSTHSFKVVGSDR